MSLDQPTDRRQFLKQASAAGGIACVAGTSLLAQDKDRDDGLHIACNEYPWRTFYQRVGKDFRSNLPEAVRRVAATGVNGFEPLADSTDFLATLVPLLDEHDLEMRSLYVNSVLHDKERVEASIRDVIAIATRAHELAGTRIIVTNPSPLRWGGDEDKSDDQLKLQGEALDRLGAKLRGMGLTLAYHNHDAELRQAAREFHHMLASTDPHHVTFCLDAHWVYRGSGNSSIALFDVLRLYGSRITELHLRQSRRGVWTETLCDGDIDYRVLAKQLARAGISPHIVLEQAVERASANTIDVVEAQTETREYAAMIFAGSPGLVVEQPGQP